MLSSWLEIFKCSLCVASAPQMPYWGQDHNFFIGSVGSLPYPHTYLLGYYFRPTQIQMASNLFYRFKISVTSKMCLH